MPSFSDAAKLWRDAQEEARLTGTKAARDRAEQARQAVASHPAAADARGFHNARVKNGGTR